MQDFDAEALGPVVCISPWNFPLAIFVGEVGAALAAGNVVLAKPAEQTPLIACRAVQIMHEAGIPRAALQFLPGRGESVGAALAADARVRGVIFTGSTEVAQLIDRRLAGPCVLIAETGGQNAMIVDSSALPEQVVQDAIVSAFDSAGQRCSALRVLCLQEEIADRTLAMLKGAMRDLSIGSPDRLSTDVGPVIDEEARQSLLRHIEEMRARGNAVFQLSLPAPCARGAFVAPALIEIASLSELRREVFGPVLHVLRYRREQLPELLAAIDGTGYGLTLGIHSRIDETIAFIASRARVGNIYVNRNIIGAVVGVQPFGGEGKSGTGPKAGGPHYLERLQRNAPVRQGAQEDWSEIRISLPGPTGERNTLSYAPRGSVLCRAGDAGALRQQVAAVLATGNRAVVESGAAALVRQLPQAMQSAVRIVDDVRGCDIRLALADASRVAGLRAELADRSGPGDALVPVIETDIGRDIPRWRLLAERALCINTAAAGGNASLMTLRD
jgi:RHH-type proline utilization regulon transcriptional repressor/proline dehydrogenase/delta 1-pyrroline-5-carboxylate dehydrogenase